MTQETLLLLHEKYPGVDALDELLPLAFRIVRFKMAAALRKSVRRGETTSVAIDDVPLAHPSLNPEDAALAAERRRLLLDALASLSERCRELLRLKLAGRNFEEIRRHFGINSINTIYTWDLRCRRRLMESMNHFWGGNP